MSGREPTAEETRLIGLGLKDPFVVAGHPLTCNGGNPDIGSHHNHEVLLRLDGERLGCPECGRHQELPELPAGRRPCGCRWQWQVGVPRSPSGAAAVFSARCQTHAPMCRTLEQWELELLR